MKKDNISAYNNSLSPEERSERSREAGKASGKARNDNKLIKGEILDRMTDDDWDKMVKGVIDRAKHSDKAFRTFRDTIGQKPKQEIGINEPMEFEIIIDDEEGSDI